MVPHPSHSSPYFTSTPQYSSASSPGFHLWGSGIKNKGRRNGSVLSVLSTSSAGSNVSLPECMSAGQILPPRAPPNSPAPDEEACRKQHFLSVREKGAQLLVPPNSPVCECGSVSSLEPDLLDLCGECAEATADRYDEGEKVEVLKVVDEAVAVEHSLIHHKYGEDEETERGQETADEILHVRISDEVLASSQQEGEDDSVLVSHCEAAEVEAEPFPDFDQAEADSITPSFLCGNPHLTIPIRPRNSDDKPTTIFPPPAQMTFHEYVFPTPPTPTNSTFHIEPFNDYRGAQVENTLVEEPHFAKPAFGTFGRWPRTPKKDSKDGYVERSGDPQTKGSPAHFTDSPRYLPFSSPLAGSPTVRASYVKKGEDSPAVCDLRRDSYVEVFHPDILLDGEVRTAEGEAMSMDDGEDLLGCARRGVMEIFDALRVKGRRCNQD